MLRPSDPRLAKRCSKYTTTVRTLTIFCLFLRTDRRRTGKTETREFGQGQARLGMQSPKSPRTQSPRFVKPQGLRLDLHTIPRSPQKTKAPAKAASVAGVQGEKIVVTVHSCQDVPVLTRLRESSLGWYLDLLNSDGRPSQSYQTSYKEGSGIFVWEESFAFYPDFEGQVLQLRLQEKDFGAKRRDVGCLFWQINVSKLRQEGVVGRSFCLRDVHDPDRVGLGTAKLSALSAATEENSFWRMFERQDADLQQRANVDMYEEGQSQIAVVLQHIRPILESYWVLLYTILRPIYWTVVDIRRLLTDWDDPGATVLAFACGLWMYWSHNVLAGMLVAVLIQLWKLFGSKPIVAGVKVKELDAKAMLLSYGESRKALYYGRIDPLSYKLLSVEQKLQRAGQSLLRFENAFLQGDRQTAKKVFGGLALATFSIVFLPLATLLSFTLRQLFLLILLQVTVFVPIRRRLPLLFPGVNHKFHAALAWCKYRFFFPVRVFLYKYLNRIREVEMPLDAEDSIRRLSNDDWLLVCREIGRKVRLQKGESLGHLSAVGSSFFRLMSGELLIKNESGVEITAVGPETLFATNVFVGHGRQAQSVLAEKPCKLYEIDVKAFRFFLVSHPNFSQSFWMSQSRKVALELHFWFLTATHYQEKDEQPFEMDNDHIDEEESKVMRMSLGKQDARPLAEMVDKVLRQKGLPVGPGAADERAVFAGVHVSRKGGTIQSNRQSRGLLIAGILIITDAVCVFSTLDRAPDSVQHEFTISLCNIEGTKLVPPKRFRGTEVKGKVKLNLVVGTGAETSQAVSTGGVAAAVNVLLSDALVTPAAKANPFATKKFSLYTDAMTAKRIIRYLIGHRSLMKTDMDIGSLYGPHLNGIELTKGVESLASATFGPAAGMADFDHNLGEHLDSLDSEQDDEQELEPGTLKEPHNVETVFYRRSNVLSDADVMHLEKMAYLLDRVYREGSTILRQDSFYDSIFLVLEGTVSLLINGVEIGCLTERVGGESRDFFLGIKDFILGRPIGFSMVAKTNVTIRCFTRSVLERTISEEPSFGSRLYEFLTYDMIDKLTRIWLAHTSQGQIDTVVGHFLETSRVHVMSRDDWSRAAALFFMHNLANSSLASLRGFEKRNQQRPT